jgi:hypothetical protein
MMNRREIWIGLAVGVVIALGYLFFNDDEKLHEQAIEQRLQQFEWAVESRDRTMFESGLSPDFKVVGRNLSGYSRSMVVDRVWQISGSISPLDVELYDVVIEIDDDENSALATFHVRLSGNGNPSSMSREQMERSKVNLRFHRYGDDWLVTEAGVGFNAMSGWGGGG